MAFDRTRGAVAAEALFNNLPDAARVELGRALAEIAQDILAAQQSDVPIDTGNLRSSLAIDVQVERLRARVGLLALRSGRFRAFYGRFIEFGVRGQTVRAKRRVARGAKMKAQSLARSYSVRVPSRPARPFIFKDRPELDAGIDRRLGEAMDRILPGANT